MSSTAGWYAPARTPTRAFAAPGALVVSGAAAVTLALALTWSAAAGWAAPGTALAVAAAVAAGEAARCGVRGGQAVRGEQGVRAVRGGRGAEAVAPVCTAVATAYALVPAGGHGVAQSVAVAGLGIAGGCALRAALVRGEPIALTRPAGRLLVVAFAALVFRRPYTAGALGDVPATGWVCVVLLTAVAICTCLFAGVLSAVADGPHPPGGFAAAVVDGVRTGAGADGIGVAVAATGVPFALAAATLGVGVLPLLGASLLLAPLALRRRAAAETTRAQTIAVLARLTETAGHAAPGRSARCARLAGETGRALGLTGEDLDDLCVAARLHDIGRICGCGPATSGARGGSGAVSLPAPVLAAAVVRAAGLREPVARLIERQGEPYRSPGREDVPPLAARVLAVVVAYEDLTSGTSGTLSASGTLNTSGASGASGARAARAARHAAEPGAAERALRTLRGSAGARFDPRVVEALAQVVER